MSLTLKVRTRMKKYLDCVESSVISNWVTAWFPMMTEWHCRCTVDPDRRRVTIDVTMYWHGGTWDNTGHRHYVSLSWSALETRFSGFLFECFQLMILGYSPLVLGASTQTLWLLGRFYFIGLGLVSIINQGRKSTDFTTLFTHIWLQTTPYLSPLNV